LARFVLTVSGSTDSVYSLELNRDLKHWERKRPWR
jgi:hypothetical protein